MNRSYRSYRATFRTFIYGSSITALMLAGSFGLGYAVSEALHWLRYL